MFGANPQPGDWVRTTAVVPAGLGDYLTGDGVPAGSRGVVLDRYGSRATVRLDRGWGTQQVSVPVRQLRVTGRGRGVDAFARRARLTTAVRVGAFAALAAPFLLYAVQYVWLNHTFAGLLPAMVESLVESTLDMVTGFFTDPVRSLVVLGIGSLATTLAFGRRRRRR